MRSETEERIQRLATRVTNPTPDGRGDAKAIAILVLAYAVVGLSETIRDHLGGSK